jgi:hypothetical protein
VKKQLEMVREENFLNPASSWSQKRQGVAIVVKGSKRLIWLLQDACLVQLISLRLSVFIYKRIAIPAPSFRRISWG